MLKEKSRILSFPTKSTILLTLKAYEVIPFWRNICFICMSWFWPALQVTGFRFKSQIKPLKTCTPNPLAMSGKLFYTSASYLKRVEFIFSLGHRWNEFVSRNLVCNKFISWSQDYCTTQLNIAWRYCSLEMETQQWILETEVHFQCMKNCKSLDSPVLVARCYAWTWHASSCQVFIFAPLWIYMTLQISKISYQEIL